jgi:2-oxoglutarate ferredoxin oxidoreductase subunit alpha
MVEDVRLSTGGRSEVLFYGRPGGAIITPEEVQEKILQLFSRQPHFVRHE